MSTEFRLAGVKRPVALVVAFIGLAGLLGGLALAQSGAMPEEAAIVDIVAAGESVQAAGAIVRVTGSAATVNAAGATVDVRGDVARDVQAAGARVEIGGTIGGDLKAGGANVTVRGQVANNIDLGGAVVHVGAAVGGRLRVGGAVVTLGPGADIGGRLQGGAASMQVGGHIAGPVEIGGAVVNFNARTDGPVTISGGQVIIGPTAEIGGDLTVRSRLEPTIAEAAAIAGQVRRVDPPWSFWNVSPWAGPVAIAILMAGGTIISGIVLMLFGGRLLPVGANHVRLRPGSSFLLGIATFILVPLVAGILAVTVFGITAGIAVLLILPFLLVFGHAVAVSGIAAGIFVRDRRELGLVRVFFMLIIGAIVVALVALIPWVGPFVVFIVLLLGLGALTRTLGSRVRRVEARPAAPMGIPMDTPPMETPPA